MYLYNPDQLTSNFNIRPSVYFEFHLIAHKAAKDHGRGMAEINVRNTRYIG